MLGAIVGDIVGSRFEFVEDDDRGKDFTLFTKTCCATDDTFMTLAIAQALFLCKNDYASLAEKTIACMRSVAHAHPNTGWGADFYRWLFKTNSTQSVYSMGNGAGMRVSPVAWVAKSEGELIKLARLVTGVTHDHPEGLKGGEAIALAVYLARTGADKETIATRMRAYYPVLADEKFNIAALQKTYGYDERGDWVTCPGSVPHAICAFLEGENFEDALRNAVSIGGDADTIGAMTGSIAEAYWGVPHEIESTALSYLSADLRGIYEAFNLIRLPRTKR